MCVASKNKTKEREHTHGGLWTRLMDVRFISWNRVPYLRNKYVVYTYTHTYIQEKHRYTGTYICTYTDTYILSCICTVHTTDTYIVTYIHRCIPSYLHIEIHIYIAKYINAQMHRYNIHSYIHTCNFVMLSSTHIHTQTLVISCIQSYMICILEYVCMYM